METKDILRMKDGDGEFSYAHNSTYQGKVFSNRNKPLVEGAIKSLLSRDIVRACKVLNVADLGCGMGPVPFELISLVVQTVQKTCAELKLEDDQVPEIQIYLNDLPTNDFNSLFSHTMRKLQGASIIVPACFVVVAPASFYGRLFPRNSLHLIHSNFALHWLSQVPRGIFNEEGISINKGHIALSEASSPDVVNAYRAQFRQDFSLFLRCRSYELVPNGYLVIALKGSPKVEPQPSCELLGQALANLVSEGMIKEEMLDSFDIPMHLPSKEEVEGIINEQGSFAIEKMEAADISPSEIVDKWSTAETIARIVRAFSDALVSHHFGPEIWDKLYDELTQVTITNLEKAVADAFVITVVLTKKLDWSYCFHQNSE